MRKFIFITIIAFSTYTYAQLGGTLETKDKMFSIAQPIGWQKVESANKEIEIALVLNDTYPLSLMVVKEKGSEEAVLSKLKAALPKDAKTTQAVFQSALGAKGTKVLVTSKLESGSFIYQYYYVFPKGNTCYALIGTSGISQENGGPEPIFNAIATTVALK